MWNIPPFQQCGVVFLFFWFLFFLHMATSLETIAEHVPGPGVMVVWCKSAKRIVIQKGWKLWLKPIFSFSKALFLLVTRNGQGEPLTSSTVPLKKSVLPCCSEESGKTWKQVDSGNLHTATSLKAGQDAESWNSQFLSLYYNDTLLVLL